MVENPEFIVGREFDVGIGQGRIGESSRPAEKPVRVADELVGGAAGTSIQTLTCRLVSVVSSSITPW